MLCILNNLRICLDLPGASRQATDGPWSYEFHKIQLCSVTNSQTNAVRTQGPTNVNVEIMIYFQSNFKENFIYHTDQSKISILWVSNDRSEKEFSFLFSIITFIY